MMVFTLDEKETGAVPTAKAFPGLNLTFKACCGVIADTSTSPLTALQCSPKQSIFVGTRTLCVFAASWANVLKNGHGAISMEVVSEESVNEEHGDEDSCSAC